MHVFVLQSPPMQQPGLASATPPRFRLPLAAFLRRLAHRLRRAIQGVLQFGERTVRLVLSAVLPSDHEPALKDGARCAECLGAVRGGDKSNVPGSHYRPLARFGLGSASSCLNSGCLVAM